MWILYSREGLVFDIFILYFMYCTISIYTRVIVSWLVNHTLLDDAANTIQNIPLRCKWELVTRQYLYSRSWIDFGWEPKKLEGILQRWYRSSWKYLWYFSMQVLFDKPSNIYKEELLEQEVYFSFSCTVYLFS